MPHGFKATEIAWSVDVGSSAERLTLLALAKWADEDLVCYPSISTLSQDSKLNPKTIRDSLKRLCQAGIIKVGFSSGQSSTYVFATTPTKNGMGTSATPTENGRGTPTKNGSTENGTPTEIGRTPLPKTVGGPLPKTVPEQIKEQIKNMSIYQSEDDSPFFLTPETPAANPADETLKTDDKPAQTQGSHPADTPAPKPKRKAITHELDLDALPDNWRSICEELRPDLNPEKVFAEFRFYWQQGRGQGTRRSDKGWTSTWLNWIKRQKEQRAPQFSAPAELPPALNPRQMFDDDYYAGCNNDELARVLAEEELKNAHR